MKTTRTGKFKKAWRQLTEADKTLGRRAITHLLVNPRYPSLQVKKMQGVEGIWEARVNRSIRLTFQVKGDTIVLRNIGQHDETLGSP